MRAKPKGQIITIEATITVFLMIIFALFSVDVFFVMWGFNNIDSCCRDAARAAAMGADAATGLALAKTACASKQPNGPLISKVFVDEGSFDWHDANSHPGVTSPYVVVTCCGEVFVPAKVDLWGVTFGTEPFKHCFTDTDPILTGTVAPGAYQDQGANVANVNVVLPAPPAPPAPQLVPVQVPCPTPTPCPPGVQQVPTPPPPAPPAPPGSLGGVGG